jgi:hypothetical protein
MNQNIVTLLIIGGALLVYTGIVIVTEKVKSKKLTAKAEKTLDKVDKGLDYAQTLAAAVNPFLPGIAGTVITKTLTAAQKAVKCVEAPFKATLSTDPTAADTRQAQATSLTKSALALDGIADTPQIDKLIDAAIPVLVLALPKTHTTTVESGAVASGTTGAV